ncbi:PREDICTED: uncharacterized protein LOC109590669 isoform X2 [Amphimedon queenslandica]|uniref:Dynein regulatory complex protein 12 n=1 Tax=Amphimedon queenslandica TaxID=400682 RepID=A0AAN0JYY3_AMPQE|nr:PREDICTED: uncharacterized protein LOC109590669 isoform X2 [Amphimedon queenslandica]|eukprot:XP_019862122.1 PREDICTED: uncharacterized protein LOC109590669 isoform X2 [Amphimedon queenslandica]
MSKAGGKGKKQMKEGDEYQLNTKEKLIVTSPAVGYLREELTGRQEIAQYFKAAEKETREKLLMTKAQLVEERGDTKDICFDLTRQYKTLELQSETKILALEETVKKLTSELQTTKQTLTEVTKEKDKLQEEKDTEVTTIKTKLFMLQMSYRTILKDAFNTLELQMKVSSKLSEAKSETLNKEIDQDLLQFGTPSIHTKPI